MKIPKPTVTADVSTAVELMLSPAILVRLKLSAVIETGET